MYIPIQWLHTSLLQQIYMSSFQKRARISWQAVTIPCLVERIALSQSQKYLLLVLVHNIETHISDLKRVLSKLQDARFILGGSKCFFGKNTMGFNYLGDGFSPTAEKT